MAETKRMLTGGDLPRLVTSLPGPRSRAIAETSLRTEPVSLTRIRRSDPPIYWSAGVGANVMDVDGNVFIDCTSASGVAAVGHANSLIGDAVSDQSHRLLHCPGDSNALRPLLSEDLLDLVGEQGSMQVTYANSGSEAVEIGIKAAFRYTGKPGILAFQNGYHGLTLGALPVTDLPHLRTPFAPYMPAHTRLVPYPNPYRSPANGDGRAGSRVLEAVERILRESKGTASEIGVVLIEPVQGSAGYIFPESGFLRELEKLCRTYRVLLFCDEIFTGLGRTGHWLASHAEGIRPDIITLAKIVGGGVPIAVCMARSEILQALEQSWYLPLHGSTFAGQPLACRAGLAALAYLRDLSLARINRKGQLLLDSLHELQRKHALIGEVRGRGLLAAIELVRDRATKEPVSVTETIHVIRHALQRGVIVTIAGLPEPNVIALAPPFCITETQLNYCVETLGSCLEAVSEQWRGTQHAVHA